MARTGADARLARYRDPEDKSEGGDACVHRWQDVSEPVYAALCGTRDGNGRTEHGRRA